MDRRQAIEHEVYQFLDHLKQLCPLPPDYALTLELQLDAPHILLRRTKCNGLCAAGKTEATISLAGGQAPGFILKTLAHEYKHVLQTAVENCKLKTGGKAREAAAIKFAEQVAPPYIIHRGLEEGCELLKDCAEIWTVLQSFAA